MEKYDGKWFLKITWFIDISLICVWDVINLGIKY